MSESMPYTRALGLDDLASSRDWLAQALQLAFPGIAIDSTGTLAEAFHLCVPTVVTSDTHIPQERYNVRLVQEQGLGLAVRDWREAPSAVARLAADRALRDSVARRLAALPANRAVYEALEIIDAELSARQPRKTA